MRYSLAIYLNNEYQEIKGYSQTPSFAHLDESKIKDIVYFTNTFEDEFELLAFLRNLGVINKEFMRGEFGIQFYRSKESKPEVLSFGISFEKDNKFFDTIFLEHYFKRQMANPHFIEAFMEEFYTYLKKVPLYQSLLDDIMSSYYFVLENNYLPDEMDKSIQSFVRRYCTKKGKDGNYKADFRKIRDLAMFAINFERKMEEERQIETPNFSIKEINQLLDHYQAILDNGNITDEQSDAYIAEIRRLQGELEYTESCIARRRIKDGTTTN